MLFRDAHRVYEREGLKHLLKEIYLTPRCKSISFAQDINRWLNHWRAGTDYNTSGIDIFEEDWDNLIILDACRYDLFKQYNTLDGQLESRISRGSKTWEFIRANFRGKRRYDTVYLADNPWYSKLAPQIDSELYHHELMEQDSFDGTVTHPETATDSAFEYANRFPDKRLIVHYYQPHELYFDEDGSELCRLEATCPARQRSNGYDREDVVDAYVRTLKLVLREIERLLPRLTGKTVITSDHGELLDERMWPIPLKTYEHPEGVYVEELIKVPWFVVDFDERKDIVEAKGPSETAQRAQREIDEQLRSLGYL